MLEGWNAAYGSLRCPKNSTYGVSGKSRGEDCLKAGVPVEMGHWLLQGEVRLHEAAAVEPLKARMLERARLVGVGSLVQCLLQSHAFCENQAVLEEDPGMETGLW